MSLHEGGGQALVILQFVPFLPSHKYYVLRKYGG